MRIKVKSKPKIELYQGDCLEVMGTIKTGSIDLILCDLPYGTTSCKWDTIIPFELLWKEYSRLLKSNGVVCLCASQPFTSILICSNLPMYRHEWIWVKDRGSNFANTVREPMKEHESIVVFSKGKWIYNKQMQERAESGKNRVKTPVSANSTNREVYSQFEGRPHKICTELRVPSSLQKFNRETGLHPTQKPVALMEYMIKTYTNRDELVLDNCMGSGTTGVACKNLDRRFIGIEKDLKYFQLAEERINNAGS